MNRFIGFFVKIDLFLLRRVFMPIGHYIDWRFHFNQYDQGAVLLSLGLAMNIARNFQTLTRLPWLGAMGLFGSVMLILVYSYHLKMLNIASKKYEKRPDQICWEQAFFIGPFMAPLRFLLLVTGAFLMTTPKPLGIIETLTDPWMVVIGCALYIAGGLPPTRKRREKKEWARLLVRATAPT